MPEVIAKLAPLSAEPTGYARLKTFLTEAMSMSHIYQPVMIKTILSGGGAATRRQIAAAFLAADLSQLEYYEQITKGYPTQTLRRHDIISLDHGVYRLATDLQRLSEWERASLIATCDAKLADYVAQRQDAIWRHRAQNFDPIPGTIRYEIIKRARGRCEACGVSNQERALQVDHIVPRTLGGSNDLSNFQALCSACNAQKLNRDQTNFHQAHMDHDLRDQLCPHCFSEANAPDGNALAAIIMVSPDHAIIFPRRHVPDYLSLNQPEVNSLRDLELAAARRLNTRNGLEISIVTGPDVAHCIVRLTLRPPASG